MSKVKITTEDFDRILAELMDRSPASHLLSIPGVYEAVSEEFNNDVLDAWEAEQAEQADDEPDEDAITTSDHETFYQYGKPVIRALGTSLDADLRHWQFLISGRWLTAGMFGSVEAMLHAYMDRVQFWPDAWFISDHGNAHRIDLSEKE